MTLRVVGAGLGRTGTLSLKVALERLLGGRCYHMAEVLGHPEHIPAWHAAARGDMPDWQELLADYRAAVDEPASIFYRELSEAFPDAIVLLSVRDPQAWWDSADQTIFRHIRSQPSADVPFLSEWHAMIRDVSGSIFPDGIDDPAAAMASFERHNSRVRETVPAHRLVEWQAGDGWGPLCKALGVPEPDEPFPRTNTREDWRARERAAEEARQSGRK